MTTYNGLDLFHSGPSRLDIGPTQSRDTVADAPGAVGASVVGQGQAPRTITRHGALIGDTAADLQSQIESIEAVVGTDVATLIDAHGNTYAGCVLQRYEPEPIERLGPRYACRYTARYLQTTP